MLRQPDNIIGNDFKQHRLAASDSAIIGEYEDLVTDWMNTIENVLLDSSDERLAYTACSIEKGMVHYSDVVFIHSLLSSYYVDLSHAQVNNFHRFMDPSAGPMSELDRWRRRQRLLTSITEQLKSKECKAVIGVLIQAKSKLLKRWKIIDTGFVETYC